MIHGGPALMSPAWQNIHVVQQWIPQQTLNFYETGMDKIVKFQPNGTDKTFVFATSDDNAKAFTYKSGSLTELVDFSDHAAANATDAAILGDKVFAVLPTELIAIDTDSGQETLNVMPRSETRAPKFVCAALGTVLGVFTDATTTVVYDMSWASPKKLWTLDLVASKVYGIATGFIIVDGKSTFPPLRPEPRRHFDTPSRLISQRLMNTVLVSQTAAFGECPA